MSCPCTVEPQYNKGARDWQNTLAIMRFHYIAVLFQIFYYYWGKLSKVILASTGQALPGLPGSGSGKMSEWKEVPSGGEAPFEFTSGEKLRHRVS